jgi:hypothetical protein
MTPQHDQYNTNTVMRGSNIWAVAEHFPESAVFRRRKGLVSGTQVVLEWHASGLLKT